MLAESKDVGSRFPDRRIRRLHLLPVSHEIIAKIEVYKADLDEWLLGAIGAEERRTVVNVLLHMKNKLNMETSGEELVVGGE